MDQCVDDAGYALFQADYDHAVETYHDFDGDKSIDVVKTGGNVWLSATQVIDAMGMNASETKNTGRVLNRIDHPDIIKIRDTSIRFSDGRRNRGSFISPRAVLVFNTGKTKGYHPIKSCAFIEWMERHILEGQDADHWSPAKRQPKTVEPLFHKVTEAQSDDCSELDPLRPTGRYLPLVNMPELQSDEVEFCLCEDERNGLGKCWCRRRGGIKTYAQQQIELAGDPDGVIDEDDVFEVISEVVSLHRIRTFPAVLT